MTLLQAQERFIQRVNSCHTEHVRRVRRSAWKQLAAWAVKRGYDAAVVCKDASDMAELERNSED